jgi:hypothetical protein
MVLVGLGALLLAYIGTLIARVPRKGRKFSMAFLHALPIVFVGVSLLVVLGAFANSFDEVAFSRPCHLAGHYSLMMVDDESPGWVYNDTHGFQNIDWSRDGIDGVKSLQIAGQYILGGRDSRGFQKDAVVNAYFLIDTETSTVRHFSTRSQLESTATSMGIHLQLEPAISLYSNSEKSTPWGLIVMMFVLAVLCLGLFVRWIKKLRTLCAVKVMA